MLKFNGTTDHANYNEVFKRDIIIVNDTPCYVYSKNGSHLSYLNMVTGECVDHRVEGPDETFQKVDSGSIEIKQKWSE